MKELLLTTTLRLATTWASARMVTVVCLEDVGGDSYDGFSAESGDGIEYVSEDEAEDGDPF